MSVNCIRIRKRCEMKHLLYYSVVKKSETIIFIKFNKTWFYFYSTISTVSSLKKFYNNIGNLSKIVNDKESGTQKIQNIGTATMQNIGTVLVY